MKHLKFILLFVGITFFVSCAEDWLDPEVKSFFTPGNVYINKEGFESSIITMRKDLKRECTDNLHYISVEHAASDLGSPWSQLDFYKMTPSTSKYYPFLTFFTDVYGFIKNTNVLISRIDNIEWSKETDRNAILSEALWFRSYWYYRLVNTYGDVPFINSEITGAKLDFYTHSRDAILDKIQADLEYASKWLPDTAEPGTISKAAANHLLAKVYLANLEFNKAIGTATEIINGSYALMTERFGIDAEDSDYNLIWDLHRPDNFNTSLNKETILAIVDRYEAPPEARSAGLFNMRLYHPQWYQSQVLDSEGKPGMLAEGPAYAAYGRGNANVRLTAHYQYNIWNYDNETWRNTQDLRRAEINWVDIDEIKYNNPTSKDFGKTVKAEYFANAVDTFKHLYAMPYYITYQPMDDPKAMPVAGNGDWYIFRLAETHLLRAEAYFWEDNLPMAAKDLNKVRERANALPVTSQEVTIDLIFDERARELFGEEPRHSELIRASFILAGLNKDGYSLSGFSDKNYYHDRVMKYNKTYEQKITLLDNVATMAPFHALWPIPDKVILSNTLGVINQNKGYDGYENNQPPLDHID